MSSSTDVLSAGSVHDFSQERGSNGGVCRRKPYSPARTSSQASADVDNEIEDLLDNVPQLAKTFSIQDKIGEGTFSSVYLAKVKDHPHINQKFALKHIIPTSHPSRIESELRCLQQLGGKDNVMGVKACVREKDHVVIIMPYFPHERFQDYIKTCSVADAREYMKQLFIALRRVHNEDIIHRDVKPSNFLVNRKTKQYALVDFGLAHKAPVLLRKQIMHEQSASSTAKAPQTKEAASTKEVHLSPEGVHTVDKDGLSSPRKRKPRRQSIENQGNCMSPRKRRVLDSHGKPLETLKEISNNITTISNEETKPSDILKHNSLTPPTPELLSQRYIKAAKSPRRALLTRRALNTAEKCTPLSVKGSSNPTAQLKLGNAGQSSATGKRAVILGSGSKAVYKAVAPTACECFGQPRICNICMARANQHAPRAGTPGFRSPEVLMKCPDQTTAVDMWSAGVILLSLLSGRYPFFKANDDMTALAQIISIIGTQEIQKAAKSFGKHILSTPVQPAVDLSTLCERLRHTGGLQVSKGHKRTGSKGKSSHPSWSMVPKTAYDLLEKLLDPNPHSRITAEAALKHPFVLQPLES